MTDKKVLAAVATLVGTTIGAGFLGIPYVVSKSGFLIGLFWIVFLGLIMMFVKLALGETILRTKGRHQLTGLAEIYLGKTGKFFLFFSMFFGIYAALIAYLIGEGESLSFLFLGNTDNALWFGLIFFAFMALLTYEGFHVLKKWEPKAMIIVLFLIVLIFFYFSWNVELENLSQINFPSFFVPFGVVLFSLLGMASLPEAKRILFREENKLKKTIIISSLIPILVYLIFAFVVVGSFSDIPEVATLALGKIFVLLGILTMFTAFFALSIAIRDMYRYDFNISRTKAWLLANFIPFVLFILIILFNLADFITILGLAGVLGGGIESIMILFMNYKSKKLGNRTPEFKVRIGWLVILLLSLLFVLGLLFELGIL